MKTKIWTTNYRPFILGGDVHAPIMAEVETEGIYDIGAGYKAYFIISPSGKTFVAESQTGAIVGSTLEEVRTDIADAVKNDNITNQMS